MVEDSCTNLGDLVLRNHTRTLGGICIALPQMDPVSDYVPCVAILIHSVGNSPLLALIALVVKAAALRSTPFASYEMPSH